MGQNITTQTFSDHDYEAFGQRLRESLEALRKVMERESFGQGEGSIGAELEMSLIDESAQPAHINSTVIGALNDPRFTHELNRFNLEFNTDPTKLAGQPFRFLRGQLDDALARVREVAKSEGGRPVPVGILPTLRRDDLGPDAMTNITRYHALAHALNRLRGGPYHINIQGKAPIEFDSHDITLEGANTSFQVHLRATHCEFTPLYNAAQLACAPALAMSGNSPYFANHELWEETRIALFKQSVDARTPNQMMWHLPPRVGLGHGWLRQGAWELFAESVLLHPPLLPILSESHPERELKNGKLPELTELRLHNGTVWRWNRCIYDPHGNGHIRIEFRALPSGPTVVDMLASAAFMIGVTAGIVKNIHRWIVGFPFEYARTNFYRAAQHGYDAQLFWPTESTPSVRLQKAQDLIMELLPTAEAGLRSLNITSDDYKPYLDLVANRVDKRMSGAAWQRQTVTELESNMSRTEALTEMLKRYTHLAAQGLPVHKWPV